MKYVLYTLAVEFGIFLIWIFFEAKRQIKQEEKERINWPSDFN
jgi:hypothetical protein